MSVRELAGYILLACAILTVAAGIWAARYFSAARLYARMRARVRRASRRREDDGDTSADRTSGGKRRAESMRK
jgi:hypothetical protein